MKSEILTTEMSKMLIGLTPKAPLGLGSRMEPTTYDQLCRSESTR